MSAYFGTQYNQNKTTKINIPDEYLCPITREIMINPVIGDNGQTYERRALVQQNQELFTKIKILRSNVSLKRVIDIFILTNKHIQEYLSNIEIKKIQEQRDKHQERLQQERDQERLQQERDQERLQQKRDQEILQQKRDQETQKRDQERHRRLQQKRDQKRLQQEREQVRLQQETQETLRQKRHQECVQQEREQESVQQKRDQETQEILRQKALIRRQEMKAKGLL